MLIREVLRRATRSAHARLDELVGEADFARETGYRSFLQASAGALLPIEAELERAGAGRIDPQWSERRRTLAIQEDLKELDSALPVHAEMHFKLKTPGQMLGALYVIEGSRLGAAVLSARAQASHDAKVRENVRYLTHGRGSGFWKSAVDLIEQGVVTPASRDEAVEAASQVFRLFENAFARRVPVP